MISTFNFQTNSLSMPLKTYKVTYPANAIGWQAGVYYPREKKKNEFTPIFNQNGFQLVTKDWYEIGGALNGDPKTRPNYHYAETTHFQVIAKNANYELKIKLYNPELVERDVDIYVNDVLEDTVFIPYRSFKEVSLDVALCKESFDLYFSNHTASNNKNTATVWHLNLLGFSLSEQELKSPDKKLGIYIASDSTAQTYSLEEEPQSGWAEEVYHQVKGPLVIEDNSSFYPQATSYTLSNCFIDNRSMGARSSKSFILEGRLESILKSIRPGDYLLIQFGDNDATAIRPNRYVPIEKFAYYIKQYIESAQARKAHPILVSPPAQFKQDPKTKKFITTFEGYRDVMKKLSEKYAIPLIELGHGVAALLNKLGFEAGHALYMQINKEDYPNQPISKRDITHFQHYGAFRLAQIVVSYLKEIIQSDQFVSRNFHEDMRPVIDMRLHKVHLCWDHVDGSDFNVIEAKKNDVWTYLDVTVKDDIYVELLNNDLKGQYKVVSYNKNGTVIKEKVISLA